MFSAPDDAVKRPLNVQSPCRDAGGAVELQPPQSHTSEILRRITLDGKCELLCGSALN